MRIERKEYTAENVKKTLDDINSKGDKAEVTPLKDGVKIFRVRRELVAEYSYPNKI